MKLIIPSVIASNAGYTFFLLPVLGTLYPDKVPLSLVNIILFAAINSLAGILLAFSIFLFSKSLVRGVGRAAGLSIALLWTLYWMPHLGGLDILILFLDGMAAFLTWCVFVLWIHKKEKYERKRRPKVKKISTLLVSIFLLFTILNVFEGTVRTTDRGKLFIIGTGPAGPRMATLQALDTLEQMDAFAAPSDLLKLFKDYIGKKPVLFDPMDGLYDYRGKSLRQLKGDEKIEFNKERQRLRGERVEMIKSRLAAGQNVGLLDSGNPCLFAPGQWYAEQFEPQDLVIIPGMGSDAAAMAALTKSIIPAFDARFVIQSSPMFLLNHQNMSDIQMLKDISKYPNSLILYMAVGMPERLFALLAKVYPPDMPCAVVYWAGFPDRERVVRGTIADMGQKLSTEDEKYMGLLFIGRFLDGRPYEAAIK